MAMMNLEKEIREQPRVLRGLFTANETVIRDVAAEAKRRDVHHVYFAARGTSDHACIYAQYLFGTRLGLPCTLGTPSVISMYGADLRFTADTMVIGVSQSGAAADVLSVIEAAKRAGAMTVSITNNLESPLASAAQFHLYCNAGPETSIAATKTFTAQMMLLARLCAEMAGDAQLSAELGTVPELVETVLNEAPAQIDRFIDDYKNIPGAVLLGRGMLYPIALEGALKILETNKLKMKGYPISDFYHGPVAQLHEGDPAILLATGGPLLGDANAMLAKLRTVGADVLALTDVKELADASDKAVLLPNPGGEHLAPFTTVVALQLIAQRLTVAKGIDPDATNVLAKVTITK